MEKIILIRHCTTEFLERNPNSKAANDSPLNSRGVKEANKINNLLSNAGIDLFACSLYLRARQTAQIAVEGLGLSLLTTANLNEYFVDSQGRQTETVDDALSRIECFLVQTRTKCECLAVVSHQSLLRTFLQKMLNLEYSDIANYFKFPGDGIGIRYAPKLGDLNWRIVDQFRVNDLSPQSQ